MFRIVERQPIVFGQPPEWYTKFEEIRTQRRLDKVMPPVNSIVEDIFNDNEEQLVKEDKDSIVSSCCFYIVFFVYVHLLGNATFT